MGDLSRELDEMRENLLKPASKKSRCWISRVSG